MFDNHCDTGRTRVRPRAIPVSATGDQRFAGADERAEALRQAVAHALGHLEGVRRDAERLQKRTGCYPPDAVGTPVFTCCGTAAAGLPSKSR
jgi:hypothetical protein